MLTGLDHVGIARYRDHGFLENGHAYLAADLRGALGSGPVRARRPNRVTRYFRGPLGRPTLVALLLLAICGLGLLVWPSEPYHVYVDAVNDHGVLTIEGIGSFVTPTGWMEIEPGEYAYTYEDPRIHGLGGTIRVDRHWKRVNLLAVSTTPATAFTVRPVLHEGKDAAFLHVTKGEATDRVFIGQVELRPDARWAQVAPGLRTVTVRDGSGLQEIQRVFLKPGWASAMHMLPKVIRHVAGEFRFTLGHVLAPLPAEVGFLLDDGVVRFMNDFTDRDRADPGYLSLRTCVTPVVANRNLAAVLRVEFPKPMRSLVFWLQTSFKPRSGSIAATYRTDRSGWRPVVLGGKDTVTGLMEGKTPPEGARFFELRAVMRLHQPPTSSSTMEHLTGFADYKPFQDPCFAIVADPDPNVARLPR